MGRGEVNLKRRLDCGCARREHCGGDEQRNLAARLGQALGDVLAKALCSLSKRIYTIDLPLPSGEMRVSFKDYMWMLSETRVLNKAYM